MFRTLSLAAALVLSSQLAHAGLDPIEGPEGDVQVRVSSVFLFTTSFPTLAGLLTSAIDDMNDKKVVLARTALEDAAFFYETGTVTGVLPAMLSVMREQDSSLAALSDEALVDSIVETASSIQ